MLKLKVNLAGLDVVVLVNSAEAVNTNFDTRKGFGEEGTPSLYAIRHPFFQCVFLDQESHMLFSNCGILAAFVLMIFFSRRWKTLCLPYNHPHCFDCDTKHSGDVLHRTPD